MIKRKNRILAGLVLAVVLAITLGAVVCAPQGVAEARESTFKDEGAQWEDGAFTEYSTGIYWYASGHDIPRRDNPIDKTKPTFIFTHGWKENEGYRQRDLLSLWQNTNSEFRRYGDFEFEPNFYQTLIDLGYNVGQFYWSQLSDDNVFCDAKIWTSKSSLGMRYFVNDGAGNRVRGDEALDPDKSVAMIFGDAIKQALGADYDKDLHLAGHSMGGQLVLATGEYLAKQFDKGEVGAHLVPTIVTLLDPYMTFNAIDENTPIDHLDGKTFDEQKPIVALCADAMETLARHGVAIDSYATVFYRMYPLLMEEEEAAEMTDRLARYCAWTYLLSFASSIDNPASKHCMAIDYYFSTLYEENIAKDNFGVEVPSAKASKEYLLTLAGKAWTQSLQEDKSGENPFYMHNSAYTRTNAYYEPIELLPTKTVNVGLIVGLAVPFGTLIIASIILLVIIRIKINKNRGKQ